MYGVKRETLIKIVKEYSMRTQIKGIKVKTAKCITKFNEDEKFKRKESNDIRKIEEYLSKSIFFLESNKLTHEDIKIKTFTDKYYRILNDDGKV